MRSLDRTAVAALAACGVTFMLVAVGATKRVLGVSDGPLEALNRALGMVLGVVVVAVLVLALLRKGGRAALVGAVVVALAGVGFAASLGMHPIPHEHAPWRVSAQFGATAAVVGALLVAALIATRVAHEPFRRGAAWAIALVAVGVLAQAALGTQLRGGLEAVSRALPDLPRAERLEHAAFPALAHLSLGPIVFLAVAALLLATPRRGVGAMCVRAAVVLSAALVVSGMTLAHAGLPVVAQVLHLLLALALCGALVLAIAVALRGR